MVLVFVAVLRNDSTGEHLHMCMLTFQSLHCSYTQRKYVDEAQSLECQPLCITMSD